MMKKENKIFLVIIALLVIFSLIMTILYFNMRQVAKNNLDEFLKATEEKYELTIKINELEKRLENN